MLRWRNVAGSQQPIPRIELKMMCQLELIQLLHNKTSLHSEKMNNVSNCVFKFYFSFNTMQKDLKTIKHNDYNHEVLKINLSLLSIISILCWRSAKQFLELIFSVGETPKLSRHSLKLPPLDVTGKIRINLLSAKHKLVVWMNLSSFI